MDIVQVLIFIGVIFFITTKKYKEITKNRPQQMIPGEEPLEDTLEMEEENMNIPPITTEEVVMEPKMEKYTPEPKVTEAYNKSFNEKKGKHPVTVTAKPEDKNIRFGTPADARRAFIYSEIFNRKY